MKYFAPDSKIMIAMGRLGDMILLNFIFLLTCIPVFTIGPALTALYTVAFRIGTDKENGSVLAYFRAFRDNFKQSVGLGLLLLFLGVCTFLDTFLFFHMTGPLRFLCIPAAILLMLVVLTSGYVFPLLSQFSNTGRQTLKNALALSLGYLPTSLMVAALNLIPFVVLYFNLLLFLQTGFLWVFLYFSAAAYFNSLMLKKVFKPYLEEDAQ